MRTRTWEDIGTTGITLVLGGAAFAGSFSHIRDVAAGNGQAGWISYAIAGSVDFMAVGSGLEIRRRRRLGVRARWPKFTLLLSVGMTLAANLATAGPGPWGALMAIWPAVAFLSVAGLLETRSRRMVPEQHMEDQTAAAGTEGDRSEDQRTAPVPPPVLVPVLVPPVPAADATDLLELGRAVAADLVREGRPLTRTALIEGVRSRGHRISTGRATNLLRQLRGTADVREA